MARTRTAAVDPRHSVVYRKGGGALLTAGGAFDRRQLPEHFDARVIHNKPTRFTRRHTQPQ